MIEILPPLADGSWWLVQCHRCREIVGEAVASQWEAERVADHHTRSHAKQRHPRRKPPTASMAHHRENP